jgi:hypothetical protein
VVDDEHSELQKALNGSGEEERGMSVVEVVERNACGMLVAARQERIQAGDG